MDRLDDVLKKKKVTVAISTVPSHQSQAAVEKIVNNGVTAILSFAPDPIKVPEGVTVHYIDLTTELQTLIYFDELAQ